MKAVLLFGVAVTGQCPWKDEPGLGDWGDWDAAYLLRIGMEWSGIREEWGKWTRESEEKVYELGVRLYKSDRVYVCLSTVYVAQERMTIKKLEEADVVDMEHKIVDFCRLMKIKTTGDVCWHLIAEEK
jgi:hypothetical protein